MGINRFGAVAFDPGAMPFEPLGISAAEILTVSRTRQGSSDDILVLEGITLSFGGVTALARDPERRDRLYAATATGYLYESGNRGQTWQPINERPTGPVNSLYVIRL